MATRHTAGRTDHLHVFMRMIALLTVTMIVLMCAHVVRDRRVGALLRPRRRHAAGRRRSNSPSRTTPRSATATPVPPEGKRLIGPITALNGLLLIGWSVAIIFEVMRMAEVQVGRLDEKDES